jgi:CRP/FNR family transcriptional regulator, cyclic AMP receptor protein
MDPKRLKSIPLFDGVSRRDLKRLGGWTDEVDIPEGKHLATQGEFAYEFFVIEDGTADVLRDDKRIATLGPGDFFGEIGLIQTVRRTATVVATSPMRLIVMARREFNAMEGDMPHVAQEIRGKLEERMAQDFKGDGLES